MTKPGDLPANKKTQVDLDYHQSLKDAAEASKLAWEKEHKLRQEAETETILIKGIGINSPEMKAAKQKIEDLQNELDRIKKENNDLYNKIAYLTEVEQSKDYFRDPDYKYLIEENHRIEQENSELRADNKKLSKQIEDKVDQLRRSGM